MKARAQDVLFFIALAILLAMGTTQTACGGGQMSVDDDDFSGNTGDDDDFTADDDYQPADDDDQVLDDDDLVMDDDDDAVDPMAPYLWIEGDWQCQDGPAHADIGETYEVSIGWDEEIGPVIHNLQPVNTSGISLNEDGSFALFAEDDHYRVQGHIDMISRTAEVTITNLDEQAEAEDGGWEYEPPRWSYIQTQQKSSQE